jgi:hypothetical protein
MFSLRSIASSAAVIAFSAGLSLAATSWTPSSGSTDNFNFSNGQTANGLFTDTAPDVFGNALLFFPNNFTAEPQQPTVDDTLSFVLNAKPGTKLTRVSANLQGDYVNETIFPTNAGGTLTLTNQATNAVITQAVAFTPAPAYFGTGTFVGTASINVPTNWVTVLVQLDANLSTFDFTTTRTDSLVAAQGGTIQLKGTTIDLEGLQAAAVPLPGALLAAPGAMLLAWVARRKMAHA